MMISGKELVENVDKIIEAKEKKGELHVCNWVQLTKYSFLCEIIPKSKAMMFLKNIYHKD